MKKFFLSAFAVLFCMALGAQEFGLKTLRLEARGDYQREYIDGDEVAGNSGFKGKFLNIRIDGNISKEFSYSYRQRLNKKNGDANFFDATDWLYLAYTKNNWQLSAGKQVVAIGGYEYDAAPIDLYACAEWWNMIPCYQWGGTVAYMMNEGKDNLSFQLCESPFRGALDDDMFAYNLMWVGSHGWFSTIYSVNMVEYRPGKFVNYISLGNKFNMGKVSFELDFMNRAASGQAFFGKDYSVVGTLAWRPTEKLNLFGKACYDVNETSTGKDYLVAPGTEITRVSAGVEYYPLKDARNDVRLHAVGAYSFGDNTNPAGALLDKQAYVTVGVTWRMNLLGFK